MIEKILTLKDTIESLSIYNLNHCLFPHNFVAEELGYDELHGLILCGRKQILIDKEQPTEIVKEAVIHELIHARHYQKGDLRHNINYIERIVQRETELTYKKLYGIIP